MTGAGATGPRASLALGAETELRCLAHYATSLAEALSLARTHKPEQLDRIAPGSLVGARATAVSVQRLLHASIAQLDRGLAANVSEIADIQRNKANRT